MKYLLDTNVLIAMFRGQYGIREMLIKEGMENCAVSEITLAEILTGAYKGGYDRHLHEITFLKQHFTTLPISDSLEKYASLRSSLELAGESLDSFDLLIAATAINHGLTLITHNLRHFTRIQGLRIRDWEA